jgi:hypothetical protein
MRKFYMSVLFFFILAMAHGQYSLTIATYSENFNTLGNTGTSGVVPTGWTFNETLSGANTTYTAGTGSSPTGDTYSFGTTAADRAFGGLQSGTLNPAIGFYFINNTGSTITSLSISYIGEQWRLGATGRWDSLNFQYSTDATSLTSGSWTDVDALDYASTMTTGMTGPVNGNTATYRTIIINTINGLGIPNGSTFFIRWIDSDISGQEDGLSIDDFSFTAGFTVPGTDHFRSLTTGNWNSLSTWESSPDNIIWTAATSLPTSAANAITIRNGHTVTLTASTTADELTIHSGGTLLYSAGTFTIDNGTGDDVVIQSGGIFELALPGTAPTFSAAGATVRILPGGTLKVSASGLTGAGTGVNASNFIYEHNSFLEWTLGAGFAFSTGGVTYFPNVDGITTPIFRTTNLTPITVGAGTATVFNGVFECAGANVVWQNAGTKTFRNGIRGSGSMDGFTSGTSGTFIINGEAAELGGSGSILTPATGLHIGGGTSTIVTMTANKLVNGTISLLANSYVRIGNFDLIVTNPITTGAATRQVVTNGTGHLMYAATTNATFPIGHDDTHYNPVMVSNAGGNPIYARVADGLIPAIAFPAYAINKTWYLHNGTGSAIPSVTTSFQYNTTDVGVGITPHPVPMEILQYIGSGWSVLPGNVNINPGGSDPYIVTTVNSLSINNVESAYALGKSGGLALAVDFFITATARKQNDNAVIKWKVGETDDIRNFEIQRANNGSFQTIATVPPVINQLEYTFRDIALPEGTNLYRIKVNRRSGNERYSNTVAVVNVSTDVVMNAIDPNPLTGISTVNISTGKATTIEFILLDMQGRALRQWKESLREGVNTIELDGTVLPAGAYLLGGAANGIPVSPLRFMRQ